MIKAFVFKLFALGAMALTDVPPVRAEPRLTRLQGAFSENSFDFGMTPVGATKSHVVKISTIPCQVRTQLVGRFNPSPFGMICQPDGASSLDCSIVFKPQSKGRHNERFQVELRFGEYCLRETEEAIQAHFHGLMARVQAQKQELGSAVEFDEMARHKKAEAVAAFEKEKKVRVRYIAEIEEDTRELDALKAEHDKGRGRYEATTGRIDAILQALERQGPDVSALVARAVAHAEVLDSRMRESESKESEACWEREELEEDREKALREMRNGEYCSECKRPRSRVEREERVTFDSHLKRVKGRAVAATTQMLQAEEIVWRGKIEQAERKCQNAKNVTMGLQRQLDTERAAFDAEFKRVKDRHEERVADFRLQLLQANQAWAFERASFQKREGSARDVLSRKVREATQALRDFEQQGRQALRKLDDEMQRKGRDRKAKEDKLVQEMNRLEAGMARALTRVEREGRQTTRLSILLKGSAE